jgi:hypothetical protein
MESNAECFDVGTNRGCCGTETDTEMFFVGTNTEYFFVCLRTQ